MSLTAGIRRAVRERAGFRCEFCGITETDAGGELTIDHFKPQVHGGLDDLQNLLYCCVRCNLYKGDYWPTTTDAAPLWNPRLQSSNQHFLELEDGKLVAVSDTGRFTVERLRLNRPPLIAWRLRRQRESERTRLLQQCRETMELQAKLHQQNAQLFEDQKRLLEEQRRLLHILLGDS